MFKSRYLLLLIFVVNALIFTKEINAQSQTINPLIDFSNGLGFVAPDSSFSINLRTRLQTRAAYSTVSETDLSADEIEARVRRLRLKLEGFAVDPRLNYMIELFFTRGDLDWVDNDNSVVNSNPNVVGDAVISYKANKNLTFSFGQTKLPGNRQRVVSSGAMQFADRTLANAAFNIDRDFGLQLNYVNNISNFTYVLKGALTSGEGRNSVKSDAGLAYTGRIELLPFGTFTKKGDYFEGDLEREKKPKLSIAGGYHYNENAMRTAGTLGKDLYESRDLSSFHADLLFKFKGIALSAEYIDRNTNNPITVNELDQERVIYVGDGKMVQLSYIFKNNVEVAGRYSIITPLEIIQETEKQKEEVGVCVTKYLNKHRVKIQSQLFYNTSTDLYLDQDVLNNWTATFQIELGI